MKHFILIEPTAAWTADPKIFGNIGLVYIRMIRTMAFGILDSFGKLSATLAIMDALRLAALLDGFPQFGHPSAQPSAVFAAFGWLWRPFAAL